MKNDQDKQGAYLLSINECILWKDQFKWNQTNKNYTQNKQSNLTLENVIISLSATLKD